MMSKSFSSLEDPSIDIALSKHEEKAFHNYSSLIQSSRRQFISDDPHKWRREGERDRERKNYRTINLIHKITIYSFSPSFLVITSIHFVGALILLNVKKSESCLSW